MCKNNIKVLLKGINNTWQSEMLLAFVSLIAILMHLRMHPFAIDLILKKL